jgi:hypothetical protein
MIKHKLILIILSFVVIVFAFYYSFHSEKNQFHILLSKTETKFSTFMIQYSYYISSKGKEIKHGIYRVEDLEYKTLTSNRCYIEEGCYINGKKSGLWIKIDPFYKYENHTFYIDDQIVMIDSFMNGKKISSAIFKNGTPFNGTIFDFLFNLSGLQFCELKTYVKGKVTKVQNCDFFGNILKEGDNIVRKNQTEWFDKDRSKLLNDRYLLRRNKNIPKKLNENN